METLAKYGNLEVGLAQTGFEIRAALQLRYNIFFRELYAKADESARVTELDFDHFDPFCDHLVVIDRGLSRSNREPAVVGTYRLLRQDVAERHGGFYSANEFSVAALVERHRSLKFLELGRSCILPSHRKMKTIELLWKGISAYVEAHRIDVLIGCASLMGTDPEQLALPLSFLHHYASAPSPWLTSALPHRYVELNRLRKDQVPQQAGLRAVPPLIRGYLRAGSFVSHGACIDYKFGTTDILMVLPLVELDSRYSRRFSSKMHAEAAAGAPSF
ncbi:MAG: GNAT family N-acetyltransferase [Methylocystis sp.]|nr:GNAT family N-acetyltransferase [Methylocystis sp.]